MLTGPEISPFTQHILRLYFPLRARCKWGEPIPVSDMVAYVQMHGLPPLELFEWLCVADNEAVAWMAQQQEKQMAEARKKAPGR